MTRGRGKGPAGPFFVANFSHLLSRLVGKCLGGRGRKLPNSHPAISASEYNGCLSPRFFYEKSIGSEVNRLLW